MVAHDTCDPVQRAVTKVLVTVDRNANAPVFERDNYHITIDEAQSLGETIVSVTATDIDTVSKLITEALCKCLP